MTATSSFIVVFLVSFGICALIMLGLRRNTAWMLRRDDLRARQRTHSVPTPRVGGIGVLAGVLAALLLAPLEYLPFLSLFAATLLPVFAAGLAEDLGFRVRPAGRMVAAGTSAVLAVGLLGVWIPPAGLAPLDALLVMPLVAIPATLAFASGICHGFNLIDGVNGLAAGTATAVAAGLWLVADRAGVPLVGAVAFLMIPAVLGFLVLNWPWGRIFLGDAGAYGIGHVLVWLAILLAWNAPQATGLALALMFFWPVADTFLAIWRRRRTGRPYDVPDRLHFHQLVYRALVLTLPDTVARRWINSLTGLVLMPFVVGPVAAAVMLWDRPVAALVAWVAFAILFVASYLAGLWLFRRGRPRLAGAVRPEVLEFAPVRGQAAR